MARPQEELFVRKHQRRTCDHEARVSVSAEASAAVVFARGVADARGEIEARVVDFGGGGVGLGVGIFLPRGCALRMRMAGPLADTPPVTLVVRRVQMTDSTPRYYIGSAFEEAAPGARDAITRLLARLEGATPAAPGGPA